MLIPLYYLRTDTQATRLPRLPRLPMLLRLLRLPRLPRLPSFKIVPEGSRRFLKVPEVIKKY